MWSKVSYFDGKELNLVLYEMKSVVLLGNGTKSKLLSNKEFNSAKTVFKIRYVTL